MSDNLLKTPSDALSEADQQIALLIAQNPATPSHLLERLSQHQEPEVLRALAKNPNTPQEALFVVGQKYTQEFLENPIVPLWFLEQPDLIGRMPAGLLFRLLEFPLPEMWLLEMAQQAPWHIKSRMVSRPSLSAPVLLLLGKSEDADLGVRVAKHPNTPPETLAWLLASDHPKVRTAALQNPKTPKAFYQLLVRACGDPDLAELSASGALSREEFERLAQHNFFARVIVANHPESPTELLLALSQDLHHYVRRVLARHPRLPLEAQHALLNASGYLVPGRVHLLENPALAPEIVAQLASDSVPAVQFAYINSSYIPREALLPEMLAAIGDSVDGPGGPVLRAFLPTTIERLFHEVNNEQEWLQLAEDAPALTRFLLHHAKSPDALWLKFGKGADAALFEGDLLAKRQLSEEVLWALSENAEQACLLAVSRHPNTPAKLLARLTDATFVAIKNTVAAHKNTSEETLAKLSQSPSASVRRAVAQNPNTPTKILVGFAQEPEVQVKRAALKTLNKKNLLLLLA